MKQGPVIPFHFIFNILRVLFWGGIYISLSPLTSGGTRALTGVDFTVRIESTTSDIAASYEARILPILQAGINIIGFLVQVLGFLIMLCFGDELNSIATRIWPSPSTPKADEFLARLDAALTLGSILRKGYTIMRVIVMYLVNLATSVVVRDRKRGPCDMRFQIRDSRNGILAENGMRLIACCQEGSKFVDSVESGYVSTAEDSINGEDGDGGKEGVPQRSQGEGCWEAW